jgi:hypothetical protein
MANEHILGAVRTSIETSYTLLDYVRLKDGSTVDEEDDEYIRSRLSQIMFRLEERRRRPMIEARLKVGRVHEQEK